MKLSIHETALLTLLRKGLMLSEESLPESFADFQEVAVLARKQTVLGIVARAIISDPRYSARIPRTLLVKLKSFVVSGAMKYDEMTDSLAKVVSTLQAEGIGSVLLKGHGLAANYPDPALRQCGDIDLYVGEDSVRAYDLLAASADHIDKRQAAEYGKHFSAFFKDIEVEVHRHTSSHAPGRYGRTYDKAAEAGLGRNLQTYDVKGVQVATPAPDFNAFYVFDHLFEHFLMSGIGLRHLCDWMMLLKRYSGRIDLENLKAILEGMDMMHPWQVFGTVLVKYLGFPQQDFPFYEVSEKADKVFARIMKEGNFGKETSYYKGRSSNVLMTKLNSLRFHVARAVSMMTLFPKQELRHLHYLLYRAVQTLRKTI